MRHSQSKYTLIRFAVMIILLLPLSNVPTSYAEELIVESPRVEIMDNARIASNEAWIRGASYDIRTSHDQDLSNFFGIVGGGLLFVGIMIILYYVKRFFEDRYLAHLWRPLLFNVW